jgi:hypothetical protein
LLVLGIRSVHDAVHQERDVAMTLKHMLDRARQQPVALGPIGKSGADDGRRRARLFGPNGFAGQHEARAGRDLDIEIEKRAVERGRRRSLAMRLQASVASGACVQAGPEVGEGLAAFDIRRGSRRIVRRHPVVRSVQQP